MCVFSNRLVQSASFAVSYVAVIQRSKRRIYRLCGVYINSIELSSIPYRSEDDYCVYPRAAGFYSRG
jgi:hypothetical protein